MKIFISILIFVLAITTYADDMIYSIYCETESQWVNVTTNVVLTNCPNNVAHTVRGNSVHVINANPNTTILPKASTASIGTPDNRFLDAYFGSESVHIGNQKLSQTELATVKTEGYVRPLDTLFYYGWLNSFNSATHQWNNEKVAQDMARYDLVIFGAGIATTSHADYANAVIIIPRVRALNPQLLLFGYVDASQELTTFKTKAVEWDNIGANGIFMDESGYDFDLNRTNFNTRVEFVHSLTNANTTFANAWTLDHILGTNNDASYPNATYNPDLVASSLTVDKDWILLESFPVNTSVWSENGGYESKTNWYARACKFIALRNQYNIRFCGVSVINNDNAQGQNLFNFSFISSLIWCLDGYGSSDTAYGANTAQVTFWTRPNISGMGTVWDSNPATLQDVNDNDVYIRYSGTAKLKLDFSTGAQTNSIEKW